MVGQPTQYNIDALNACMTVLGGNAGPVSALGDVLRTTVPGGVLGQLDGAEAVLGALNAFCSDLRGQLSTAGARLDGVHRALDAVHTSVVDTDEANAQALTV